MVIHEKVKMRSRIRLVHEALAASSYTFTRDGTKFWLQAVYRQSESRREDQLHDSQYS